MPSFIGFWTVVVMSPSRADRCERRSDAEPIRRQGANARC
jgi:hypothetical protein